MEQNLFTNLGVSGASLFIIWMIIRYFMQALDKKDEYIKNLIELFQSHVELCNKNFIESSKMVTKSSDKQTQAIQLLLEKIGKRPLRR